MVETVEESRRIVADLEGKFAAAESRATELQTERRRLSFDANTGDGAAEKRLRALNTEAAHINLDVENVRSAIDEAKRRLAAAERDEALAAARDSAASALVIGDQLLECAAKIDAALATAREEMWAYKRNVDALHLTGCAAPTAQQFLTFLRPGGGHVYDVAPGEGRPRFPGSSRAAHFWWDHGFLARRHDELGGAVPR